MPRKKKNYNRRRRRYYRKKKGWMLKSPIAKQMITKLKYQTDFSIDPGLATVDAHVFSANGLYDVDITGTGHQPRGWDELITLYDHAVVVGSKIKVNFVQQASAVDTCNIVGISLKDSSSEETTGNDYMEGGYVKYGVVNSINANSIKTITYKCNPNKFLSRSKPLSDPYLKNSSSTNPTEQAFWHVWGSGMDGHNGGLCNINVNIEYLVVFLEPKNPAQS